jgi:glycosyltransferase involved in cell wall biosynthesis
MTNEKGLDLLGEIGAALPPATRQRVRIVLLGGRRATVTEPASLVIHAAGFVDDIDPAIAGLDILIHPSRTEGLGTAVIDAMSLGVPPIAFAVGGVPEVIDNDISGVLVPADDTRAFAAQLARLVDDEGLRARLSQGARIKAKTFDATEMTNQTESVYEELLSG